MTKTMTREDIADRLGGTATAEGVLLPWEDAALLLELWLEHDRREEELHARGLIDLTGRVITPVRH